MPRPTIHWLSPRLGHIFAASFLVLSCSGQPSPPRQRAPEPPTTPVTRSEASVPPPPRLPPVTRVTLAVDQLIETAASRAIERHEIPGTVVAFGDHQGIAFLRAYGSRQTIPNVQRNSSDTLYDLASLTKPFTALAVLRSVAQGRLGLSDSAQTFLPELVDATITVEMLLRHSSGFRPADPLSNYDDDRTATIGRILRSAPELPPGTTQYSDLNFIALGAILERVHGKRLDEVIGELVTIPLDMNDTSFRPRECDRVAPTEFAPRRAEPGQPPPMVHCEVHDPRAWRLQGVAGNAGLFSTAQDLAKLGQALLTRSTDFLPESLWLAMESGDTNRTLGWERAPAAYGFSERAFGHTGFTGTSLYVDPANDRFVVALSNRVHPDGQGDAGPLRRSIAQAALSADLAMPSTSNFAFGIDLLRTDNYAALSNKRVAVLTHDAARARDGARTIDLLLASTNVVRIFTPEHGLGGDTEGPVENSSYQGVPVVSLFGDHRSPSPEQLRDVDILVIDLQDVGARFYTYASTLHASLRIADRTRVLILDRPNPLGSHVAGAELQPRYRSFVNHYNLPILHGLTLGELARLFVREESLPVHVDVVTMQSWDPSRSWTATNMRWTPPSPNLPNLTSVSLYPAVALLEGTNINVGRRSEHPFATIGAPWFDPAAFLAALGQQPGVRFSTLDFQPTAAPYRNERCHGIQITPTGDFDSLELGYALVRAMWRTQAARGWNPERLDRTLANDDVARALRDGGEPPSDATFRNRSAPILLYTR